MAAVALVLGLVGGGLGAAAYDNWTDDDEPTAGPGDRPSSQAPTNRRTTPPLSEDNGSIAAVADTLLPSTVQVIAEFEGQAAGSTGSGFVFDTDGNIVTNNHVVAGSAADDGPIEVVDFEGNRYEASLVGRSPVYDLAVLKVDDLPTQLAPAALGESADLIVGDGVVALGSPLGLTSTVTSGIVSALDRPVTTGASQDEFSYINAIQTDAAINPGNSGGPLVNLRGEVVGVNSAIATTGGEGQAGNIGVGFAIPMAQVRTTADQILADGEARYPVIGATLDTGVTDGSGAVITDVLDDSPAQDAGLQKGDTVTAINDTKVTDGIALIVAIRTYQPGDSVELAVLRDEKEQTVEVTLDAKVG